VRFKDLVDEVAVTNVANNEFPLLDELPSSRRQVIDDDWHVARVIERIRNGASDESSASGNQNLHGLILLLASLDGGLLPLALFRSFLMEGNESHAL
jgi:hypothetical protein